MALIRAIFILISFTAISVSAASNMVFKKIEVQMGAVGSDDDIRVRICDINKCCTTKVLSNLLSGEWRAKKKETWDGGKLGNCSQILFDDKLSSIDVTILKDGKRAGPEVSSMVLSGQVGSDKKKITTFQCGSYKFSASDRERSNRCSNSAGRTSSSSSSSSSTSASTPNMAFKKIEVQMGAVASDDDIRMKICDTTKCCTTKVLSNLLSSEWVAKKKETWDGGKLGNCSQILFSDKLSTIEVSLLKDGKKAGPEVDSIVLTGQVGSDKKKVQSFRCGSYRFSASDRQKTNFCSNSKQGSATTQRTTQRTTKRTTQRPRSSSSSSSNMVFKKIDVQMGAVGSDDDIRVKICDTTKCCTTAKLSNLLSSEWVAKKKETWDGGKLGNCSQILFDDKLSSIEASILKNGKKDGPEVANMNITGQIGKDKKNVKVYRCGRYKLSTRDNKKSGFCLSNSPSRSPSLSSQSSYSVSKLIVQMGDDGTNDDVSLDICNKKSSIDCCNTGNLDKSLSDDWSKNDLETWNKKDIKGTCKTKSFDACKGFDVAIKKGAGKDSLKVKTITMELSDAQNSNNNPKYICSDYNVGATDTVRRRTCSLDPKTSQSLNCPKPTGTIPRGPAPTAKPRPSRLPTQKASSLPSSGSEETVRIESFTVEMGNDGTKDPVFVRVCSDTEDVDVCCETPVLNKPSGVNWGRNGDETWPSITLGECSGQSLPTKARTTVTNLLETKLEVTVNKKGKDNLLIDNLYINTVNSLGAKRRFKCPRMRVDSEKATQSCYTQFAKPAARTTARPGPCLRSGRNCGSTTSTRPPFRSGSG